jgi:hypothetical protein
MSTKSAVAIVNEIQELDARRQGLVKQLVEVLGNVNLNQLVPAAPASATQLSAPSALKVRPGKSAFKPKARPAKPKEGGPKDLILKMLQKLGRQTFSVEEAQKWTGQGPRIRIVLGRMRAGGNLEMSEDGSKCRIIEKAA